MEAKREFFVMRAVRIDFDFIKRNKIPVVYF